MADLSVQCGCGRKMTLDALRGRGAYRCGCGARIKIQDASTTAEACTVPGCRFPVVEDDPVVRVCFEHRRRLILSMVPVVFAKYPPMEWRKIGEKYHKEFGITPKFPDWTTADVPEVPSTIGKNHAPVVYFIALGDQVKIGTTNNIRRRFAQMSLPPDACVEATIPGDIYIEHETHSKFASERIGSTEWFRRSERLDAFIKQHKKKG